ncbi:PP2C family protein-serine/threonine phosphatase [Pseudosporangium ferrugineum]|uniref:Serine phosphatase RsbU (Regulator of sigma subunit) n=1 Tax=Pseudosporangium ferrugineum TaxID=439699 RepID=A0A2T0S905_9ACTN|nr:PP2C family protein-serine/threonine phosphatase [Pseudosporangium ferrugineum]PRY29871.1 serine phosphatase RsbU (regulator of sigma subunit) [Pseudosporangium ferrugineum]
MADDRTPGEPFVAQVQEILAAIPSGCTWLLPVTEAGEVADFTVAATSGQADLYGRGVERRQARLSELYPTMVGGPLWTLYRRVLADGVPGELRDFEYEDKSAGVVAHSRFVVSVRRVLGGLLVWWQRSDEHERRLDRTEQLGSLGWAEYDLVSGRVEWSPGMFRLFGRDPAEGPLPRVEQAAAMVAEDRGIAETAWQTLDAGSTSDVTVRFRTGTAVKHLRILSEVARDADGAPVKIYAVVQDVTARVDSRSAIERLADQLRVRETTALAEHRLAAQLQNMIQPVPAAPLALRGLQAIVGYLPAGKALRVGGDWYHAQTLPDGRVLLAVGDVAGHGLDAASGMAHLRFALVAWLSIGIHDPGQLLGHLNRLCAQLGITGTAVVGCHDPASGTLSWARAGHLPPLLSRAGTTEELPRPPGLLLGADQHAGYPVAAARLEPGDLVLFYTDGLVERREIGAEKMLANVKERLSAVSALSAASGEDPLARLRGLLRQANPDDDTCLLAVRVLP